MVFQRLMNVSCALGFLCLALAGLSGQASGYEQPTILKTQDALPGVKLIGPNYRISETVENDGLINRYTLQTATGTYKVQGTDLLLYRLRELDALISLGLRSNKSAFTSSAEKAIKAPIEGAKKLVDKPVQTVEGFVSGVGSFFDSLGHAVTNRSNEQEDNVLEAAVGFDVARRQWAAKYRLDPYTSFEPIKDKLEELSWSATGGNLAVTGGFSAIPGGAGAAVSLTKATEGFNNLVYDKSPAELEDFNGDRLSKMGINQQLIRAFLRHPEFSPTHKTEIIDALYQTPIGNRGDFLVRAAMANNEATAFFMMRWAQMYAAYHKKVAPLRRFVTLGRMPTAQRGDGVLVVAVPTDHVTWTKANAERHFSNMNDLGAIPGVTGGELWFAGSISPMARENLEQQNWAVTDFTGQKLGIR